MAGFWTPAKVERLTAEWKAGTSVRAIAGMLGGSRNAIIGKARRLALPMHSGSLFHPGKPRKPAAKKPKETRRAARIRRVRALTPPGAQLPPPPPSRAAHPHPLRVAFADLEPRHCRYSVSPQAPHFFCGHQRQGKSAFCAFHHALCHEPLRRKPRMNVKRISAPFYPRAA